MRDSWFNRDAESRLGIQLEVMHCCYAYPCNIETYTREAAVVSMNTFSPEREGNKLTNLL